MSPAKKFTFSFIAIVCIPALFFFALEGMLRLIGVGTDYTYFHEIEINGQVYYQDNKAFANQFYPPSLGVAPLNNTISADRDENHIRVYILGGSAAQGFPHVNHGLDRHLGAHLKAALPDKTIEVVNTAMTSVNSHVVYEVARTLPANSADYAVILMGNNEVVGPYGPSTFNQNFLSNLWMIRTLQTLKRTRTWQVVSMLIQQFQPAAGAKEIEWEGMQMFSGFSVTYDDPRLSDVYGHYENNLNDIISLLQDKGMRVILSSVPVNLRDSAPFGSAQRADMSDADQVRWEKLNEEASVVFEQQNWPAAEQAYRALLDIDSEYADSHFRLATALENMRNYEQAKQHFEAALRFDTKRFRTDAVLNDIIAKVAAEQPGSSLTYVDSVSAFNTVSAPFVPGWNLLHEHVHFDFDGNYHLAEAFAQAIVADTTPTAEYTALEKTRSAELIGFPNHETNQVMNRLLGMVQKSPFTEQSNFSELAEFTTQRRDAIVEEVGNPSDVVARRQNIVQQGVADWKIHYELAELHRFLRDKDASLFHLTKLIELYPHNHESYIKIAEQLSADGKLKQAIEALEQSLYYTRNDDSKKTQALGWIGSNHMKLSNYQQGKAYFEQVVDQFPDQIGANIMAYGALIKNARDNKQHDDFHHYLAGVKRYAKRLIAEERVQEFPLLYRRMAQIMTIAGDTEEAQHWQKFQEDNR